MSNENPELRRGTLPKQHALSAGISRRPMPTLARVNAPALGGVWKDLAESESARVRQMGRRILGFDYNEFSYVSVELGPPLAEAVLAYLKRKKR